MKKILSTLLILLFLGVSFTGCEKIKGLADHTFETDLDADLYITTEDEGGLKSLFLHEFDQEVDLNPQTNPDIYDYWEEIKSIKVKGIELVVTDPGKLNGVKVEGNVSVAGYGFETVVFTVPEWTLVQDASYKVTDKDGKYTAVGKMLESGTNLTIRYWGTSTAPGYMFTVKFLSTVDVTANPL